jgi:hypothetical protein
MLFYLVRDTLLRLVSPLGMKELALIAICALFAVGTRLLVEAEEAERRRGCQGRRGRSPPEKLVQGRSVPAEGIVWWHKPERKKEN